MPKGKKKGYVGRRGEAGRQERQGDNEGGSDDENAQDGSDNMSVSSCQSDAQSYIVEGSDDSVDETSSQENFEEKLKECIDNLTVKSAKGRVENLQSLKNALSKKYIYDFITDRKVTILDALDKCLKKGKGDIQALAASCIMLLVIQLGAGDESEEVYKEIKPLLQTIMADNSAPSRGRTACAEALGVCKFVVGGELEQAVEVMKALENIFKASYLKGDGNAPSHTPEIAALHTSAISSWSLLLSIAPTHTVQTLVDSHLTKMPQLLTSADLELRITTGETIALAYELAREIYEDFYGDDVDELCVTLKQLATDGNKYRAKKDRRQQRATFRDILRAVEEGDVPAFNVRFGQEVIYIDSWAKKRQYDALCHVLGSGMNVHLKENELIRDIFALGAPIPLSAQPVMKISKADRHAFNAAAFKARTKARSKFRDKRAVVMHSDS